MSNKPQSKGTMRSLADMPKPIIVLEGVGIILLIIVLLALNDYITLPEPLMQSGAIVSIIMVGIGCLVPAMINIVWRAIHGLSFLGIDNKQPEKKASKKSDSTDNKLDE
ncbi:TPA: YbjC family protein [Providencia rettgeri]|uniref:YbjC family protein n=1 Tax=unclassified Providencia TaxID=2633465 RepID=UPI00234982D7|nr:MULTISPECIES: YbjC family protein [unclassified Providencia]HEP0306150.1 YbjC family protein [Providencia rettgeri]